MRFTTRTFLWSFVPVAFLLMGSFWVIQTKVVSTVRNELRSSLRENQVSIARVHSKSELQNSRFLRIVGENAALKAGVQLVLADRTSDGARLTVEDQLRDICQTLGFDFLLVSNVDGAPLAGVMRVGEQLVAMNVSGTPPPKGGFFTVEDRTYQVASTLINQGDENIGTLSAGERFDFSEFSTPAVLTRNGKVVMANLKVISRTTLESALKPCPARGECTMHLNGEAYLSLPLETIYHSGGYLLRTLQNIDSASGPVQSVLRGAFATAGIGALLAALIISILSSRSIARPISKVVAQLRESRKTGVLPQFSEQSGQILELRALTESFNEAAAAIQGGRDLLHRAYIEFIGSLASALDARDRYTAGHSDRVSDYACDLAAAMGMPEQERETIRIGALLHDVGKIGIADAVLQKPGRLTKEEFAIIQLHPTIGRRILEGVHGFEAYLPVVELHHENWDGTGYPLGLRGDATPLCARIVHVADVYDAITSSRPYRGAMSNAQALRVMEEGAGTQFDPAVIEVFMQLPGIRESRQLPVQIEEIGAPLRQFADALSGERTLSFATVEERQT